MKGEKTTKKTMVSSVTVLVLLLLVNLAAVQARQVISNSDMDGCTSTARSIDTLAGWSGMAMCDGGPCSYNPGTAATDSPTPDPFDCAAFWRSGDSPNTQILSLSNAETAGLFDFQAYFACIRHVVDGGNCVFFLTIDGQSIALSGLTTRPATAISSYTILSSTGISISNPNAVISLYCAATSATCVVTQATLTTQGIVSGDPHALGFDGQIFDVLGQPNSAFNLLSDFDVQV